MPNPNAPFGLQSMGRTLSGGFPEILHFTKATADVVYPNDAVNQLADGTIEADSATPGTTNYSGISLGYGAAAAAGVLIPVIVSPDVIFIAQADGSLAAADMGLNTNLVLTAGDSTILRSKHQLNSAAEAVTATLDVKLRRLFPRMGNEFASAYPVIECIFNKHRNAPGVAGV